MAGLGVSGLIGVYLLIGSLLLGIVLFSNGSWKIKAGAIVITSFFYTVTYLSFPPLLNKSIVQMGEYHEGPESNGDSTLSSQKSGNIQFYDLPDPMFPDK